MQFLLLALLCCTVGCESPDEVVFIEVGEPYDSVQQKLEQVQARSLQGMVGILCSPDRCEFYELQDGTAIEITIHRNDELKASEAEVMSSITIGEAGLGYQGKRKWMKQLKTSVTRYNIVVDYGANLPLQAYPN